jgi:hypothetical protein
MLIDIKATLLRRSDDAKKIELAQLKELLNSEDFKVYCGCPKVPQHKLIQQMQSRSQNRLNACMLSPNITAYVTDTHSHIMVFSK